MKKGFLLLIVIGMITIMTSCQRPYMRPVFEEIGTNETAFLVALEGDTKDNQKKMDSMEFYEAAKVQAKRIEIPQRWVKLGRGTSAGKYVPTMKLVKVDRSPVTRQWFNDGQKLGDKAGINVETKSSVGVSVGVSLSARIDESDTAKYLYYYNTRPLAEVMDKEIYGTATSILGAYIGKLEYEQMTAQKSDIVAALQSQLTKAYAPFGITIYSIGLYGGLVPDNPKIQESIDNLVIAENDKKAAAAQNQTNFIKAQTIDIENRMVDINYKKALTNYINAAAEKGIKLVPEVQGSGSPIINLK